MNITVWGAGNSGVPAAIYFLNKGHAVTLFTRSTEKKNAIAAGGIDSDGVIRGHFDLAATDSVRAAVQFADLLVINKPAGMPIHPSWACTGGKPSRCSTMAFSATSGRERAMS